MTAALALTTDPLDHPEPRLPSECPVEIWLALLGHRWSALLLWHLQDGALRFRDLKERLPQVTAKVLSERLENLCRHGLLVRSETRGFPIEVSYGLSESGRGLMPILDQIERWSRRYPVG
ncbi:helix-turn-helix transcriptional regulator [Boseaceae bacterium BT-24-1]|nr:helix-turn-helix transcriptional regulator [Boseaceae bacterium BT-24-1]